MNDDRLSEKDREIARRGQWTTATWALADAVCGDLDTPRCGCGIIHRQYATCPTPQSVVDAYDRLREGVR